MTLAVRVRDVMLALDGIEIVVLVVIVVVLVILFSRVRELRIHVENTREAQGLTQATLEEAVEGRAERWKKIDDDDGS